jgi:polyphosphate kinase
MPDTVRELLIDNLEITPEHVWELENPLGLNDLFELTDLDRPDLKDPPLVPRVPVELRRGKDPFEAIRDGDMLLHHPYDAFSSVPTLSRRQRANPIARHQTDLYRVGQLAYCRRSGGQHRGKRVAVLVGAARFDGENNISGRVLEQAGIHVVYSQANLRRMPRWRWSCAARRQVYGAMRIWAPATTTPLPGAHLRTMLLTCRPESFAAT